MDTQLNFILASYIGYLSTRTLEIEQHLFVTIQTFHGDRWGLLQWLVDRL